MITEDDLKQITDDELDALSANVEKELTRRQRRRAREAVKQARALLAAAGFEAQIYPIGSAPAADKAEEGKGKRPAIPKGIYRDPQTGSEWKAGRGRPPSWLSQLQDSGLDLSKFRVEGEAEEDAV